eukprot:scaffold111758_cov24-Tisochrysis_lutea.AAC.1
MQNLAFNQCNVTEALGQKDQARSGGWMPLWHLPIPMLRNGPAGGLEGKLHHILLASCAIRPLRCYVCCYNHGQRQCKENYICTCMHCCLEMAVYVHYVVPRRMHGIHTYMAQAIPCVLPRGSRKSSSICSDA